eukprot:GEZU01004702.1.p1 GENE.GEZU01004702.1~~GEZU01004702.1.p1  ORF type:complete len:200 (+),score=69.34 GEZU01004702.1:888-1487(+)
MSAKQLRRMLEMQEKQLKQQGETEDEEEDIDPIAALTMKPKKQKDKNKNKNVFALLVVENEGEGQGDSQQHVDEEIPAEEEEETSITSGTSKSKKKKSKKKKNKTKAEQPQATTVTDEASKQTEELDEDLLFLEQEIKKMQGPGTANRPAKSQGPNVVWAILSTNTKDLNPDTELKRMFGANVVRMIDCNRHRPGACLL